MLKVIMLIHMSMLKCGGKVNIQVSLCCRKKDVNEFIVFKKYELKLMLKVMSEMVLLSCLKSK